MSKKPVLVCIGNSIINGFPHRRSQCFVSLLRQETDRDVINKGVNGDTAIGVLRRFDADVISKRPDAVMILAGTNDFVLGQYSPQRCMDILKELAEKAQQSDIETIFLTPIICDAEKANRCWMPADYDSANKDLVTLSQMMKEYASSHEGCHIIDLQEAYKECNDFVDGLHPTIEGHRYIADFIKEQL